MPNTEKIRRSPSILWRSGFRLDPRFRNLLRAVFPVWALAVIGFSAVRVALAFQLESITLPNDLPELIQSFAFGFVQDVLMAVPISLVTLLILACCRAWKSTRALAHLLVVIQLGAMFFGFIAEIFFWNEFSSRLNGVAIYYLIFPREVIGNLRESFPLEMILPAIAVGAVMFWWVNRSAICAALSIPKTRVPWLVRLARIVALAVVPVILLSEMPQTFGNNRELDQLAHNGLVTLVSAALTNDAEYEGIYPTLPKDQATRLLRSIVSENNSTFLSPSGIRRHIDNGHALKKLNIVIVTEESFGSVFVDSLDNELGYPISPDLEGLARKGLMFTNIYASGDRTVRGLEATETAFAPIPGISTSRRPGAEGMYSLPHLLNRFGYVSGVLYGGLATFDNMGNFWEGIGFDHVWDQRDVRHDSFSTIWGVSDEDLFTEALRRMDEQTAANKPVLLTLMTVSNHRPYRFPQTSVKWDDSMGKIQNTARYAQHAFVDFVDKARAKPWFDDTVFVFVADHSVKINGAARVPVHSFRIPLVFYAPKHIRPGRVDTLGAQIDMIPTLLGLLGFSYDSPFFGVDLLRIPKGGGRITIAHNFSIAYGRPGHVVVLDPNGELEGYTFSPGSPDMVRETPDPKVLEEAIAQTQEAHRMFYAREYHWK